MKKLIHVFDGGGCRGPAARSPPLVVAPLAFRIGFCETLLIVGTKAFV
jgi:hypothetical protein